MILIAEPVDADLLRLRHEFLVTPALCLTAAQTARLLSIHQVHAEAILDLLKEEGWLICSAAGRYRRPEPLAA